MKIVVKKRKIKGRKTESLRKEDILPGVIYGPKRKSLSIELDLDEFEGKLLLKQLTPFYEKKGCI